MEERPLPELEEGQVVVAVEASPINPSDLGVLLGPVRPDGLSRDGDDLVGAALLRCMESSNCFARGPSAQPGACRKRRRGAGAHRLDDLAVVDRLLLGCSSGQT